MLTCRDKHLYFSSALSMHYTKLTKTKPFVVGKHWPVTTTAQIRGDERFQDQFWIILEVGAMGLADSLTDSSEGKCFNSPLG